VNVLLGLRIAISQMRMNIDQSWNHKVSSEVIFLGIAHQDIPGRSDAGDDPGLGNDGVVLEDLLFGPLEELPASHMDLFGHRTPFPSTGFHVFPIDLRRSPSPPLVGGDDFAGIPIRSPSRTCRTMLHRNWRRHNRSTSSGPADTYWRDIAHYPVATRPRPT